MLFIKTNILYIILITKIFSCAQPYYNILLNCDTHKKSIYTLKLTTFRLFNYSALLP